LQKANRRRKSVIKREGSQRPKVNAPETKKEGFSASCKLSEKEGSLKVLRPYHDTNNKYILSRGTNPFA